MGWAKFDDKFTDHPKVVAAGPLAELLAMRGVIFCARYETDGFIQFAQIPRISVGISSPKRRIQELVDAGLWEQIDGGFLVHDFLDYHPSAAERAAERESARERMANVRANKTRSSDEVQAKFARSSAYPDPTRPQVHINTLPKESKSEKVKDETKARKPDLIWDAVIEACGLDATQLTQSARGAINKTVQQLKQVNATPQDIHDRARQHLTKWPNVSLTPTSLAKNWAQLQAQPGKNRGGECRDCGQPLDSHEDEICRMVSYR